MVKTAWPFIAIILIVIGVGCDKNETSEGLIGLWRCNEIRSDNSSKVYNVSVDKFVGDSTYVIYNMYNLGMDAEVYVKLGRDSVFTFTGCNIDSYSFNGSGIYSPTRQTIEWNYSVLGGGGVNDPLVKATFTKD